ncbi:MAG: LysE family translocator [Hyphomicrobiaceae bacterium]
MDFIPEPAILATYTLACAVLFFTPGPDMSLFIAKTMAGGKRAGFAAFVGASTGTLVHTSLAALGISALLAASATAFLVMKVIGALYLLWLAVDALRSGSVLDVGDTGTRRQQPIWRTFAMGVGINLTNPKIILFFVTFLPQFVAADDPNAFGKLLFLGLYYVIFALPFGVLMVLCADHMISFLRTRSYVLRAMDWIFASVFCAFAVRILTTDPR